MSRVEREAWERVVNLINDPIRLRMVLEQAQGSEDHAQLELDSQRHLLGEAEGKMSRLIDRLADNSSPSVQKALQQKLDALTRECDGCRAKITELDEQLSATGRASVGLRELLEGCQAGLASIIRTATAQDHGLGSLPVQRLD